MGSDGETNDWENDAGQDMDARLKRVCAERDKSFKQGVIAGLAFAEGVVAQARQNDPIPKIEIILKVIAERIKRESDA